MTAPAPPSAALCPVCGGENACVASAAEPCWCDDVSADPGIQRLAERPGVGDACLCRRCLTGRVPSPCVGICRLDDTGARCTGCGRTLAEVAAWGRLTPPDRAAVLLRIRAGSHTAAGGEEAS